MAEIVESPDTKIEQVRAEVAPIVEAAKALVVTDRDSYEHAMSLGAECTKRIRRVEEIFAPSREAAHSAWKTVTATIASFVDPLKEARQLCGDGAKTWARQEETRVRQEEAARTVAAQEKVAILAEAAGAAPSSMGLLGTPAPLAALAPPMPTSRIVGTASGTVRSNWVCEVTDLMVLVKAVAAGEVDLEVLQPDESVLRRRAKALKGAMQYPGVRVWDEGVAVFKAR